MSSNSFVLCSVLIIFTVFIASSIETSFAEEIIATSTGFENSAILELKNSRGNAVSIDSVRIWLSGENEFKSFKTEQGWMGKNTPQGVIIFTSQNGVNPGEGIKFGIKTTQKNPTINWKAVDAGGEVIASQSTKITINETNDKTSELNKPKIIAIKDNSSFRFIPEKPTAATDFRVIGENFVPNQSLDFYIGDKLTNTLTTDQDGKILFTSKAPSAINEERVEFTLRDSGGIEKTISIRIPEGDNREISQIVKLSLGNTPQEAKRGEIITLQGIATPNTTLTIKSIHQNGEILDINTIDSGFDGKWTYDNLFSPELDLGQVSIEVDDGKSQVLRNIQVVSAKLINIFTEQTEYQLGDTINFEGVGIPNTEMSVVLEDPIGAEIFSRSVSVSEVGTVKFNIEIPRGSVEGTYVLLAFQGQEEGVTIFGVGQEPEPILIVRPVKLNFAASEDPSISIQGPTNAQVSVIIIDSADREKISTTINLGPDGKELLKIDAGELGTGAYTLDARRGESTGSAVFTVGLSKGSGAISVQTTKEVYKNGEQILILGNTGSVNVLLDIIILDPNGNTIKKIETFSDKFGVFKVDNFRIPVDALQGVWTIDVKSGGNFDKSLFTVEGEDSGLEINLEEEEYNIGDLMVISGSGARMSATVTITIYDSEENMINELNITAKNNGEYTTIWMIPIDLEQGEYEIRVDDGLENSSIKFNII